MSSGVEKVSGTVILFLWTAVGTKCALQAQSTHGLLGPERLAERTATIHGSPQRQQFSLGLRCINLFHPVGQTPQRLGGQQFLGNTLFPSMQASPAPILRTLHEVGAEGVPLNVTTNREEMSVVLHGEGLEPALIEVAATGVVAVRVPALGVGQGQPPRESRQFTVFLRPNDWAWRSTPASAFSFAPRIPPERVRTRHSLRASQRSPYAHLPGSERDTPVRHRLLVSVFPYQENTQKSPSCQDNGS